ncbi:MAG TPA: hypothetical protein VKY65_07715 [Alphaproteobacteria bacterium]|nr:hypothetical protein [Alphaproteobacteria bacterium]
MSFETAPRQAAAGPSETAAATAPQPRRLRWSPWRLIPPLDADPRIVAFVTSWRGRALLVIAFGLLLIPSQGRLALPLAVAAAACAYAGAYRRGLVVLATLVFLYHDPSWYPSLTAIAAAKAGLTQAIDLRAIERGMLVLFLLAALGTLYAVRRFRTLPPCRRPILSLHLAFAACLLLAAAMQPRNLGAVLWWSWVGTFAAYFWFLCYAVLDQTAKRLNPLPLQLGAFHPFWGSSTTPIGKGWAYLRRVEARDARELAVTQLKGLKLLLWSLLLWLLLLGFRGAAFRLLRIPDFDAAFTAQLGGVPYPWYLCWASLVCGFLQDLLTISIWGHTIVACARLAGFRLLRNTYRPLESRTVAEFWNRYYFYFKELLVEVFFYPTFMRCFRRHPRLRLAFATFMAAGVGNMIWHYMRDIRAIIDVGLAQSVIGFQTFAFYALVLATGIAVSQAIPRKDKAGTGWLRRQFLPCLRVAAFYCLLHVFDDEGRAHTLPQHLAFLLHLFGLNPFGAGAWI